MKAKKPAKDTRAHTHTHTHTHTHHTYRPIYNTDKLYFVFPSTNHFVNYFKLKNVTANSPFTHKFCIVHFYSISDVGNQIIDCYN
jgi:D-alanyl-D-alanine dipeptidase